MGDDHFIRPDNDQVTFDSDKWERVAVLVAQRLASFRCGPDLEPIYNEDDMLRSGVIIGDLWTKGFIDF